MIASVDVPPPKDETATIEGAGASELSGPDHSTTEPSEYVCRTSKEYVFAPLVDALKRKTASSSVGTWPPVQEIVDPCAVRLHPGEGSNESMAKPAGTVSTTVLVVTFSFSVGTERVNCCSFLSSATAGLTIACADAAAAVASAASATSAPSAIRCFMSPPSRVAVRATRPERRAEERGRAAAVRGGARWVRPVRLRTRGGPWAAERGAAGPARCAPPRAAGAARRGT